MPVKTNRKTKSTKLTFGAVVLIIIVVIAIITAISFFVVLELANRTLPNFFALLGIVSAAVITAAGVIVGIYAAINNSGKHRETFENKPLIPFTLTEMKERFGEFGSKVTWIDRGVSKVRDLRIHGRLVITGPMKIGKTREAHELMRRAVAENLVSENRLYRLNSSYFDLIQDENIIFPRDLDREQPLLILIDDFPFHYPPVKLEKLGEFLSTLTCCKQLYLVATARIDQLTDEHRAWLPEKKFQSIEMPDLDEDQTRSLVDNASGVFGLQMETEARELFVKKNNGTPQLPLMAMQRLRANGTMQVDAETSAGVLEENIAEQWLATRRYIEERHPAARYIIESLITFSQAQVPAYRYFVFQYALYLWNQDKANKSNHKKKKLEETIDYLEHFGIIGFVKRLFYPDYIVESNHGFHADIDDLGKFLLHHRRIMANRLLRRFYLQANEHAWELWDYLHHNIYSGTVNFEKFDQYAKQIRARWKDARLYSNLGNLLGDLDRKAEAEEMYRKAIEVDPQDASAYYNLGVLLAGQKREAEAEEMWRKAIEVDPQKAEAYTNLRVLLIAQKRYDEAEEQFQKALDIDPEDDGTYYNLACLESLLGNTDKAFKYLQKAFDLGYDNRKHACEDSDFANIRDDPRFEQIVGCSKLT